MKAVSSHSKKVVGSNLTADLGISLCTYVGWGVKCERLFLSMLALR